MHQRKTLAFLIISIAALSVLATTTGIFSDQGPGVYLYKSIRGETIPIYGKGLYHHMSAEVAIQGIAQDYVTLFLAVPLLLFSCFSALKGSLRARFVLAGTLGYFLVTYLFYLVMAMYNAYFLVYTALLGFSFFALAITLLSFPLGQLASLFKETTPVKVLGGFLNVISLAIGLLWLSIVVPPLLDGTIYPKAVEHYTTLIVQGLDLGLLLPLAFVTGVLLRKKKPLGYLLGPTYYCFLALLMTALVAKILHMGLKGYTIVPAIFIIPVFALLAMVGSYVLLKNLKPTVE
jgi:hypothetical protein